MERKSLEAHVGERYGRLLVVGVAWNEKRRRTHLLCKCDCGAKYVAEWSKLKSGKVKSCGCLLREKNDEEHRKAEKRKASRKEEIKAREFERIKKGILKKENQRLYYTWQSMLRRCLTETHPKFPNYGGRGITVCSEWLRFGNFVEWAKANGYNEKLQIDRIDTNGNYEPTNCHWADFKVQQNNRRNNCWLMKDGVTHTMAEWAEILGIRQDTLKKSWRAKGFARVGYKAAPSAPPPSA